MDEIWRNHKATHSGIASIANNRHASAIFRQSGKLIALYI
ncbi:hypothetical protein GB2207_10071 [marine gamma proteobacterium HTCC2207]|uniref:Uncharacterized protein n=1 Tax=gamma proteobacterium HTCC2207 TaxID=314287 RepID=Q1YUA9_9GAMM|nr:hypothetical protein GB2207_10071 [marine gamma proteobacterium HTCC2207] [gamma proteobacterium HTCC2207]